MSELYLMVTIMDRNKTKRFRSLYESCGIHVAFDTVGYGTAASEMLEYFGLEESEKAVALSVVTDTAGKKPKEGWNAVCRSTCPAPASSSPFR
jgi:hypothetical protein